MKITRIEKQKKRSNRYNIFLDGEFAFGLYDDTILKYGLRTNDELSPDRINEMREEDEYTFGKNVAYKFLSYRQRSEKEIRAKLKEKKIQPATIEKIIKYLRELKYLDDELFSKMYLQSQLLNKPAGKRLLKMKMLEKGISKDTADKILKENYNEEDEIKAAKLLLSKYTKRIKKKDEKEIKKKCFQYLISRGFDFEIAKQVIGESDD